MENPSAKLKVEETSDFLNATGAVFTSTYPDASASAKEDPFNDVLLGSSAREENLRAGIAFQNELLKKISSQYIERASNEMGLQRHVGKVLIWAFVGESAAGLSLLTLFGMGRLHFPSWVVTTFFVTVFAHTAYLLRTIVDHLFHEKSDKLLERLMDGFYSRSPSE